MHCNPVAGFNDVLGDLGIKRRVAVGQRYHMYVPEKENGTKDYQDRQVQLGTCE
jgi:hypothetical protein